MRNKVIVFLFLVMLLSAIACGKNNEDKEVEMQVEENVETVTDVSGGTEDTIAEEPSIAVETPEEPEALVEEATGEAAAEEDKPKEETKQETVSPKAADTNKEKKDTPKSDNNTNRFSTDLTDVDMYDKLVGSWEENERHFVMTFYPNHEVDEWYRSGSERNRSTDCKFDGKKIVFTLAGSGEDMVGYGVIEVTDFNGSSFTVPNGGWNGGPITYYKVE